MKVHDFMPSIKRHKPYKERLVDMVSDSMRALLLESIGYKVHIFDFTPEKYTSKNIMLCAEKNQFNVNKSIKAMEDYEKLFESFNIRPALENYLK